MVDIIRRASLGRVRWARLYVARARAGHEARWVVEPLDAH